MDQRIHCRVARVFVVLSMLVLPLHAQAVHEQMLVSPDWLQRRLGKVTLLHIDDAAGYDASHIPGAVLVELSSLLVQRDGTPNELPSGEASMTYFVLRYLGYDAALYDGSFIEWSNAGEMIGS